jgi:hypothetical protein
MVSLEERSRKQGAQPGPDPRPSTLAERIDVRAAFPGIAATVSICGAASNAGKTWLCESVLRDLRAEGRPTVALKVTRTHLGDCPRGIEACGTCDSLAADFELVRERARLDVPRKDTGRYFSAGADHVLWLLVKPSSVRAGLAAALAAVPAGCVLVAEGNSFRDYASADVTLMALSGSGTLKPSALHVVDRVDAWVRPRASRRRPAGAGPVLISPGDAAAFVLDRLARGPLG